MWLLQEVTFLSLAVPIFSQISRTMAWQHKNCGFAPQEIIQPPPFCQRQPRTGHQVFTGSPVNAAGSPLGRQAVPLTSG
jgi:hypothetical protein